MAHRAYVKPPNACKSKAECAVASERANANVVNTFELAAKTGAAWPLKQGQTCRFLLNSGAQVGDVNLWNLHDFNVVYCVQFNGNNVNTYIILQLQEYFYSGKTRCIHAGHLSIGDRLWSCMPYLRPMATVC